MSIFRAVKSNPPYYQEVVLYFKTNPCPSFQPTRTPKHQDLKITSCKQNHCFNYHNDHERRRLVFHEKTNELLYEPKPCQSLRKYGKCLEEEKCRYAHTENEVMYHPLYYKTQECEGCQFEDIAKLCPRYHADEVNRSEVLDRFIGKNNQETSNLQLNGEVVMPKNFILDTFKTKPCTNKGIHNPKVCAFYHSEQDRRRAPQICSYSWEMCSSIAKKKMCSNGDSCNLSHSMVEQLYHPDRYKKKFCEKHPHNTRKCKYANYCSFAHSETEIKINLLHNQKKDERFYQYLYKTVFCPYIFKHDRNQCVYAHNPQDFRRDPSQYNYKPIQCPDWSQGQIYSYDEGKCLKGMECEFCHGWKELEFHPFAYKTKSCTNLKSCVKMGCPFLHGDEQQIQDGSSQGKLKALDRIDLDFKENSKGNSIMAADYKPKLGLYDQHHYELKAYEGNQEFRGAHSRFNKNYQSQHSH